MYYDIQNAVILVLFIKLSMLVNPTTEQEITMTDCRSSFLPSLPSYRYLSFFPQIVYKLIRAGRVLYSLLLPRGETHVQYKYTHIHALSLLILTRVTGG